MWIEAMTVSNGQLHTFTHNLYKIIYCKKLFKIHIHITVVHLCDGCLTSEIGAMAVEIGTELMYLN